MGFCLLLNIDTIQPFGKTYIGLDQHKVYNLNKGWGIATLYLHPYTMYMSNEMDNSDFNSNGLVLRIKSIFSLMPGPKCEIK